MQIALEFPHRNILHFYSNQSAPRIHIYIYILYSDGKAFTLCVTQSQYHLWQRVTYHRVFFSFIGFSARVKATSLCFIHFHIQNTFGFPSLRQSNIRKYRR